MSRIKEDSDGKAERLTTPDTQISWKDVAHTLKDPIVLALSFIYFCAVTTLYTISYFLPAMVAEFGVDPFFANLLTAPIYFVAVVVSIASSIYSDKTGQYLYLVTVTGGIASLGWGLLAWALLKGFPSYALYTIVVVLVSASWTMLPPLLAYLTLGLENSTQVAVGTALAVSVGNFGGYVGPTIMGISQERYHTYGYAATIESGFAMGVCVCCFCLARYTAKKKTAGYVALQSSQNNP